MYQIRFAISEREVKQCWEVINALGSPIKKEDFLKHVLEMCREGYYMIYIVEDGAVVAFAGYRNIQHLLTGKFIHVEDLFTHPEHCTKKYAAALLNYICALAAATGKNGVYLDSNINHSEAHLLYANNGFQLTAYQFGLKL